VRRGGKRRVERFLTTVLFTDIVGSTQLAAELGDRGWRDLVQEHHKLVRAALRRHGGREVDTAGDGFFAVFDAPAAAAECALDVVEAVPSLGLQVRAGLHVGEVEQIAGKVGGISVPIGSRIMSAAEPGEVLVSTTVRELAAGAGFRFEDRGTRQLKGVPGEWHLFAVTRPATTSHSHLGADASSSSAVSGPDRAGRRASAVRRAQARPWWQRHPRATAGIAVALVLVVAGTSLLVWSPWLPPALPAVSANSLGVIDPARNVIVDQAPVGNQPSAIAFGEGGVWIANRGDDTISQVDPATHTVIDTIDVGKAPTGIAIGGGSIWVADSGERSVTRINAATRRVVDQITVGNGPRAIAFGAGAVWVANYADGTVSRLDADSGSASEPIGVGSLPTAIAADDNGVWVVGEDAGTVTELDPATGAARAAPIAVGARPAAIAIGGGAVWVANSADGSISKIDPEGHRVVAVVDVGGSPVALADTQSALWVAFRGGFIERIDPADTSQTTSPIATDATPTAIAAVPDGPWFVAGASAASHRGGTLRIVSGEFVLIDPTAGVRPQVLTSLLGDGLVGYRRVGGVAGSQLLPDLATSIPAPTDGGLTYSFQLRPGLVYSDGSPILASDFRFAIERAFQVEFGGGYFFIGLKGADACAEQPVKRCDLSEGIETDDARRTVTFHLSEPDPDFLYRLALSFAEPVPQASVPANELIEGPYPVTGPYVISSVTEREIRLTRNPHFQPADADVRPDGYVNEVIWTKGIDDADQVQLVETGAADFMLGAIPVEDFAELRKRFTPQLHRTAVETDFVVINPLVAPFDHLDVRRAVAFALDREKIQDLRGGPIAADVTCQILPPNFPGYEPYCPFTKDPGPAGQWTAPDLQTARRLVASSGTAGAKVVVGPMFASSAKLATYLARLLTDLGYRTSIDLRENGGEVYEAWNGGDSKVQIGSFGWGMDFPAPDDFLGSQGCDEGGPPPYCAEIDAAIDAAYAIQATDPAAANRKWAEIDRMMTDMVLWAPFANVGSQFVSARLGNYQFSLGAGFLADQAWVK
jgi:YVTN family beta-propeller protein